MFQALRRWLTSSDDPPPLPPDAAWRVAWRSSLSPLDNDRRENQDNLLVIDTDGLAHFLDAEQEATRMLADWPAGHRRFAVLDGMGGHRGGREVAEAVVAGLLALPAQSDPNALAAHLEALHARLQAQTQGEARAPGAAITLIEAPPGQPPMLFHVGDTRLYEITEDTVRCVTVDHVPATRFALQGQMQEAEWRTRVHEESWPYISQAFALGHSLIGDDMTDDRLRPDLYELSAERLPAFLAPFADRRALDLRPGVLYLLASDGLWHFHKPMEFVARWPAWWRASHGDPQAFLDTVLAAQREHARDTELDHGDNTTGVAFVLTPRQGDGDDL